MTTARIWTIVEAILVGIAWIDYMDIGIRILSGVAAVIVAYFASQSYRAKRKLTDIEAKIKQEELNERFRRNGHV